MTPENQHFDRKSLRKVTGRPSAHSSFIDFYFETDKLSFSG